MDDCRQPLQHLQGCVAYELASFAADCNVAAMQRNVGC